MTIWLELKYLINKLWCLCVKPRNSVSVQYVNPYYVFSVYETNYLFNRTPNAKFEDVLNFKVNYTNVGMVINAFYGMISETEYDKLKGKIRLEKCSKKLFSYASKNLLPVLGQCKARITVPETGVSRETDFIVIPNAQVSLLSYKTSKELGILKIGFEGEFRR